MLPRASLIPRLKRGLSIPLMVLGSWPLLASLAVPGPAWSQPVDEPTTASVSAPSAEPAPTTDFFERGKEGWFWYEEPPEPPPPPPSPKPSVGGGAPPATATLTWEDFKRLPPDAMPLERIPMRWLRAFGKAKLEYALDDPLPERVHEYIVVQRAIYARSERFTQSWQLVMYRHPELDVASTYPTSDVGTKAMRQQEEDETEQALRQLSQRAGLFFFFTSTCRFCQTQSRILKVFADTYGFSVLPISLDGKGLPEFPEANPDTGIARNLEVKMVPMLYLAIPDEHLLTPVGAGVLTLSDLKTRILALAKADGAGAGQASARGGSKPSAN